MPSLPYSRTPMLAPRRDLTLILATALAVNAFAAYFVSRPGYMDAYYYFGGGLLLARGQGFSEPYLWNYLDSLRALPHPSHLYWMPLASLVAAPFIMLAERLSGGPLPNVALFRAAQIPFLLLASLLPWLSYAIASRTTGLRRHAVAAALLTIFSGFYVPFWANTDAFALYGLTAGGALLACALAVQASISPQITAPPAGPSLWYFLAGLGAGLAHLTRADGMFVILTLLPWMALCLWRRIAPRRFLASFFLTLFGYLLVMLPWFVRNLLLAGTPFAPGGTRVLWLTEYNDLFNYPADTLTPARYFASGWGSILAAKWLALRTNLLRVIAEQGTIVVFPFILLGLWRLRHHPPYSLAILYGLNLFALMTLIFTFPGPRGGLFHSGAALLPFFFPAALVGLDASVDAVARRLPHWQPEKSKPVFTALLVLFAAAVTALIFQMRVIGSDGRRPKLAQADEVYAEIGGWLANVEGQPKASAPEASLQGTGDAPSVVAVNNPPAFYFFTGHPSIVIPNGGPEVLLEAMSAFDARWVVLDVNHPSGLAGLYASPHSEPRLTLRATFSDDSDRSVYLFERMATP